MYPDTVTFNLAVPSTDDRGGITVTFESGSALKAYVETVRGATSSSESASLKPIVKTRYQIYIGVDPSAGRSRTVRINDQITWVDRGITLQVLSVPNPQGPLWLVEAERVS